MRALLENSQPEEKSEILKRFQKEIEKKICEHYSSLRTAFRQFDLSKKGLINESEFIEGLVQVNVTLNE